MNIKLLNKIYIIAFFIFLLFTRVNVAFASTLTLTPSKDSVGLEEEFYLDVLLDPEGNSLNGIEGSISFKNEEISLVRILDGKSMVSLWIEKPKVESGNRIIFSGIMPNGFDGVIDPFNTKHKLPGQILRLVFKGLKQGVSEITTLPSIVTLNDGEGTIENMRVLGTSVKVENYTNPFTYISDKDINPELDFEITQDPNLYDNKFVLIFKSHDKETGIEKVMIKEGKRDWQNIESPYLLIDQSRHSGISLMAVNFSGASIIKTIDPIPYKLVSPINISLLFAVIILLFILLKKIYDNKYKK